MNRSDALERAIRNTIPDTLDFLRAKAGEGDVDWNVRFFAKFYFWQIVRAFRRETYGEMG